MSGAPIPRPQPAYEEPAPSHVRTEVVRSPSGLLLAGLACGLGGVACGVFGDFRPVLNVLGWLLGSLGAVGFVAAFTAADARRRADPWFVESRSILWLRIFVLLVGLVAVVLNAWHFADYISRLKF